MNRRHFIVQGLAATTTFASATAMSFGQATTAPATRAAPPEVSGGGKIDQSVVNEFVAAAHGNFQRVKEMLAAESPAQKRFGGLVLGQRELILGDLETALGGAAHTANRDIALYLLDHGARIDAFAAAMLGYGDFIKGMLKASPISATTKGPHMYTLLYHAALSGEVSIAEDIKRCLPDGSKDYNQALTGASRQGHLPMVQWLLSNGVTDPSFKDGTGTSSLTYATRGKFSEIVSVLQQHGAK